jgi:regulator of sirC expression with transglutaminase-like and TPR domain
MGPNTATARFASLLARPERDVPLDEAALLVAAHAHPGLDVARELARIDELTRGCRATPAAIAARLFVDLGFAGNRDDYGDPRNSLLDDVMDRRLGIPITLSVLMIEVGRRLGVRLEGIGMPGHFLVGAGSGAFFDPFDAGCRLDEDGCRARFAALHPGVPFDQAHLAPVGTRAVVTRVLANLERSYAVRDAAQLAWVTRLRLLVPGRSQAERRQLAARLASLGAYADAADALDALASDADDDDALRLARAARAQRARGN